MDTKYSKQIRDDQLIALDGQVIFDEKETSAAYQVLTGEVLILRNGQIIDLVQPGELLDASIWNGATAVAWSNCILQRTSQQSQPAASFASFDMIQQRLQQFTTSVN